MPGNTRPAMPPVSPYSVVSVGSLGSILGIGSIAALASVGSIASLGSVGSIASIGSVGSIASIGKVGAIVNIPVAEKTARWLGNRLADRFHAPESTRGRYTAPRRFSPSGSTVRDRVAR